MNFKTEEFIGKFEAAMQKKMLIKSIFYKTVFGGKGFEFDSFREYTPSDDSSSIDWRESMKAAGELMVRQYVEERDLRIFFIIDTGSNMVFGSGDKLKADTAAQVALSISHLVLMSGDKVGYALYNKDMVNVRPFSPGIKQFYSLFKDISSPHSYGGFSNLKKALEYVRPYLKNVSAVFIISDFLNLDEETIDSLKKFSRLHETVGIMVRDVVDNKLSNLRGEVIVEDIKTGEQLLIEPNLIRHQYEKNANFQKKKIEESFKKFGTDLLEISNNEDFILPLVEFLKKRTKKRRFIKS